MTIHLLHAGLILEAGPLSGTLIVSLGKTGCPNSSGGIELKEVMGLDGIPPAATLDFSEAISDFERRGATDLQLKISLQAHDNGGPFGFLLRYPGGQHPEAGSLRPGQSKAWAFHLLL
jgi:hypothetical protein